MGRHRSRQIAGAVMAAVGGFGVWYEIGRQSVVIRGNEYGGSNARSLFVFAVVLVAGVALAVWHGIQIAKDEPQEPRAKR